MARTAAYDREKALEAAMNLFWRKGYHATSLKDLEAELSMRPGSIYAAFHSKEALFRSTLDRYSSRTEAELVALIEQSPSPLNALQLHLRNLVTLEPCDRPSMACMLVKSLMEISNDGALRDFIAAHLGRVEIIIGNALEQARELGELPPSCDIDRLTLRVQTYIFGLKIQAQRETDVQRMSDLCADLADDLLRLAQPKLNQH